MPKYVVAGGTTINSIMQMFLKEGYATIDSFKKFLDKTTKYYLTSIGEILTKKKNGKNQFTLQTLLPKGQKLFDEAYYSDTSVLKKAGVEVYVDSGGFQISMGYIPKDEIMSFYEYYKQILFWLNEKGFRFAFSLDVIGDVPVFDAPDEIIYYNRKVLERMISDFPTDFLQEKILFVYHFIHRKLEEIWWEFVRDYFNYFKNFTVGGLVAFQRVNTILPIYSLPLLKIIAYKKQIKDLQSFSFHILGVSTPPEVLSFCFIEEVISNNIIPELEITFDSTTCIRQVTIAKQFFYFEDGKLSVLSHRPEFLSKKHKRLKMTTFEIIQKTIEDFNKDYDCKIPIPNSLKDLYPEGFDSAPHPIYERVLLFKTIESLQKVADFYKPLAKEILNQNSKEKFVSMLNTFYVNVSPNKLTKSLESKILAIKRLIEVCQKDFTVDDITQLHRLSFKQTKYKLFDKPLNLKGIPGDELCF